MDDEGAVIFVAEVVLLLVVIVGVAMLAGLLS
jgi:hypothetical protein